MVRRTPAPACSTGARRPRPQEIERRRVAWVVEYTGKQEYEFGDLTAKFVRDITGKDDYEFGECARASRGTHTPSSEPRWCALIVTRARAA